MFARPVATAAVLLVVTVPLAAFAATVAPVGSQLSIELNTDDAAGWRSPNAPAKPLDIDGDSVLGTDGYAITGSALGGFALPSYVASVTTASGAFTWGGSPGYALIDNPSDHTAPDVLSGTWYVNGLGAGLEADLYQITLTGAVPATTRLALLWDNSDNSSGNAGTQYRVRQTTGGAGDSGYVNITLGNATPDWYFFDLTGAQAGDVLTVSIRNNADSARNALSGGVAFDSLVPEPATAALTAAGLLALFPRRRPTRR